MKRTVSILLIFMFLYNSYGFLFTYFHLKKVFKKEAFEKIDNFLNHDELITLGFKTSELNEKVRFEHSREFKYNDEMYDIFSTEERNDSIFYRCICDKNETHLEKSFSVFFKTETGQKSNHPYVLNILRNIIFAGLIPETKINLFNSASDFAFDFYAFTIVVFLEKEKPPPRIC